MIVRCAHTEMVDVDLLVPHPLNPNKHGEKQIEMLAKIMKHQGWRHPITVSKRSGFIVAGHGRLMAAKKLGWTSAPIDRQEFETEADEYAHLIADNKIAELAEHDDAKMFEDLKGFPDLDLDLLGIPDLEIPAVELIPQCDPDDVPDALPEPKVVRGEVYILGKHRLMCGDSTVITDVERLMNGEKADMVFTDPPYNVAFKGQRFSSTTKDGKKVFGDFSMNNKYKEIANDDIDDEGFSDFIRTVISNCFISLKPKHAWYFCFAQSELHLLLNAIIDNGGKWKNIIIWMKNQANLSNMDYKSRYEPIVYFQTGGRFFGERYKTEDIWEFQRTLKNDLHPTMKPIPLIENAIANSSESGDSILDLFGGSGSTLIACEKTNRQCFMMELDPIYCAVILDRWQKFTGQKATREDGKLWDEIRGA